MAFKNLLFEIYFWANNKSRSKVLILKAWAFRAWKTWVLASELCLVFIIFSYLVTCIIWEAGTQFQEDKQFPEMGLSQKQGKRHWKSEWYLSLHRLGRTTDNLRMLIVAEYSSPVPIGYLIPNGHNIVQIEQITLRYLGICVSCMCNI